VANRNAKPPGPPKWQQVVAPRAVAPEPPRVLEVPADRLDDPRELAEAFARLPEHAKAELRDRWRGAEGAREEQRTRRKETKHRWVLEGAALLFVAVALLQTPTRLGLVVAVAVGAVVGGAGALVKPGPLLYGLLFAAVFALFGVVTGFGSVLFTAAGIPIVFGIAAALAVAHRLQRFDSTEL
jgi:hypothetical protein